MAQSVYARFRDDQLTLRDHLAIDRTIAANERTLLGYVRTTLALVVTGASLIKFLEGPFAHGTGVGLLAIGGLCFAYGSITFGRRRRALSQLADEL